MNSIISIRKSFSASGATGSVLDCSENTETFTVKYIQHTPKPVSVATLSPSSTEYEMKGDRPKQGFALKKTSGVRTVLTERQKEIMIEFFNQQNSTNV